MRCGLIRTVSSSERGVAAPARWSLVPVTLFRRATKDTDVPGTNDAATISRLSTSGRERCGRRIRKLLSIIPVVDILRRTPAIEAGSISQTS